MVDRLTCNNEAGATDKQKDFRFIRNAKTLNSVSKQYLHKAYCELYGRLAAYEDLGPVEELAALKEQTRWIPVSERLPKYGPNKGAEAYWIAKKTRNGEWQIKIALYSDYGYATTVDIPENVTWRDYDFCQITNVAYWMPLPEAPKETDHE